MKRLLIYCFATMFFVACSSHDEESNIYNSPALDPYPMHLTFEATGGTQVINCRGGLTTMNNFREYADATYQELHSEERPTATTPVITIEENVTSGTWFTLTKSIPENVFPYVHLLAVDVKANDSTPRLLVFSINGVDICVEQAGTRDNDSSDE